MNSPTQVAVHGSGELQRYDTRTIVLHWTTAALVVVLWVMAHFIDDFPRGPARINMRSAHILLGTLLGVVLVYRIYWRALRARGLPPISAGMMAHLAKTGHIVLYALLIATVVLGIANSWVRGDNFFNQWTIPSIAPGNKQLRKQVGELHELASNLILIVAGIHAMTALVHHFVVHDATLRRMLARGAAKFDA